MTRKAGGAAGARGVERKRVIEWTPDRTAMLQSMWKDGKSGMEIAQALGFPQMRNAIIAKAHRLRIGGDRQPNNPGRRVVVPEVIEIVERQEPGKPRLPFVSIQHKDI